MMNTDVAAIFLASSILVGLGIVSIGATIVALNYMFTKYWTPFSWNILPQAFREHTSIRFAEPHELNKVAPTLDKEPK
jgi:hypothetical protein